jgi:rare lipoprotein A
MKRRLPIAAMLLACASLAACATAPEPSAPPRGTMKPYVVKGVRYVPRVDPKYKEVGMASWYGPQHQGRRTADGEVFDMNKPSAAHKTLPLPSIVEVKNLDNGRTIKVRVNDRGPFVDGRIIDLSKAAAEQLGFLNEGLAKVRVRYVGPAS